MSLTRCVEYILGNTKESISTWKKQSSKEYFDSLNWFQRRLVYNTNTKDRIIACHPVEVTLSDEIYHGKAELFCRDFRLWGYTWATRMSWVFRFFPPVPVGEGTIPTIGSNRLSLNQAIEDVTLQLTRLRETSDTTLVTDRLGEYGVRE